MRSDFSFVAATALLASSASAATISIAVGESGLTFSPNSTTAAVGDVLEFTFYPKNHTVVQGAFNSPCDVGSVTAGFYSGFMPTSSGTNAEVFQVTVNDTKPIWFYCSQGTHCQSGMVGVINPPTSGANTLLAYKTNATTVKSAFSPKSISGGVLAAASGNSSGTSTTSSATGTSSGTSTTASASSSSSSGAERVSMRWAEMVGVTGIIGIVAGLMI